MHTWGILRRPPLRRLRRWLRDSASNALEIARLGRLAPAEGLAFEIVDRNEQCKLRRYLAADEGAARSAPLVLIPPLMLTAEIYDVAPELSAVRLLTAAGIDTFVVDFGAPEREEGGMERTLDDHVRAVAWAVERAGRLCGRPVHLGGYSQGGMFAYQATALLRSAGVASLLTFGSPVDIHQNVPSIARDLAARFVRVVEPMLALPLGHISGLPGKLSSTGFKLLTPRKELAQLADFVRKLHDRQALARRESRRRFLGGEGFVAWPGPALRRFVDEFVVHNRMVSGGIVIDGRTLSLADIRCPVLMFVGNRDDFAAPAAVRAIRRAAPEAEVHEILLAAGHFGLVVGSTALAHTWPDVAAWVHWRDGAGPIPAELRPREPEPWPGDEPEDHFEVDFDYALLTDEIALALRSGLAQLGNVVRDVSDTVESLRWQLPRLARLERMTGATRISPSLALSERARANGSDTFFLWHNRAFCYRDADVRVDNVVRGLCACGIEPGDRVGVLMGSRPSLLSVTTALNRLGAVAVIFDPALAEDETRAALGALPLRAMAVDPEHADRAVALACGTVLVLGGVGGAERAIARGAIDLEAIDPADVLLPGWYRPSPGRARDTALVFVRPGRQGSARLSRVSNGRWAFSALGVASAATLTPDDTVYCCLPLHHPTGLLVAVGGALSAGARLALADRLDPARFWREVRRYGATVVFYAGELARPLVMAPPRRGERNHPVRLFAGSGMRVDVWERLRERFGTGVLELYASTERNLVLANASGEKLGSVGRPLPGGAEIAIVRYDFEAGGFVERARRLVRCDAGEAGVAIARVGPQVDGPGVRAGVFEPGDRWFVTDDVLRRDRDGDYWFVDRLGNLVRTAAGVVATPPIEDAIYALGDVDLAVAYGVDSEQIGQEQVVAAVVCGAPLDPVRLSEKLSAALAPHARPRWVYRVESIPTNTGFRPMKTGLRAAGSPPPGCLQQICYDEAAASYRQTSTDGGPRAGSMG